MCVAVAKPHLGIVTVLGPRTIDDRFTLLLPHILRRAGYDSPPKTAQGISRSDRQLSSTAIVVHPSVYTDKQRSTTIQAGSFNLQKWCPEDGVLALRPNVVRNNT
jgi:hypothetical protein